MIDIQKIINKIAFLDGSLRDIYIYDVTLKDWDRLLKLLKDRYPLESDESLIPDSIDEIISICKERGFLLKVMLGKDFSSNCHFYVSEDEPSPIEFDIDPHDMQSPDGLKKVLQFINNLGDGLRKEVFLTAENSEDVILLSYSPFSKMYSCTLLDNENHFVFGI